MLLLSCEQMAQSGTLNLNTNVPKEVSASPASLGPQTKSAESWSGPQRSFGAWREGRGKEQTRGQNEIPAERLSSGTIGFTESKKWEKHNNADKFRTRGSQELLLFCRCRSIIIDTNMEIYFGL